MFCLLSISSLHKYTIGWLRFKWNWIRIHFRSCSHYSLKQMNFFCIRCRRRNLKFTKDNNRVFQLKQLDNIHIKMSWIIIKLWIYNDYKLVIMLPQLCASLHWSGSITLSKSLELRIERVMINVLQIIQRNLPDTSPSSWPWSLTSSVFFFCFPLNLATLSVSSLTTVITGSRF